MTLFGTRAATWLLPIPMILLVSAARAAPPPLLLESIPPPSEPRTPLAWGNALYVDLAAGDSYSYHGKTITLVSTGANYARAAVGGEERDLIVARRALPEVINGVRVFVAVNRNVADLTTDVAFPKIHDLLTKDALLVLSDPSRPLLDPSRYGLPAEATSPADHYEFEVAIPEGHHLLDVRAAVGDLDHGTWQRISFEGIPAGEYGLEKNEFAWTPLKRVTVNDGKLTVRIELDGPTPAGLSELIFHVHQDPPHRPPGRNSGLRMGTPPGESGVTR